jgi:hypothetical protein
MPVANAIPDRIRTSLTTRLCLVLICICGAGELHGADFSLGEFTIRIPDSFEGPRTSSPMAGLVNHVFSVPTEVPPAPALMFVIREGDMAMPAGTKPSELLEISRTQANKMVDAAAGRRTEFRAERPHEVMLAGRPAIAIAWSGKLNGMVTKGNVFCLTTQKAVYLIHLMGPAEPTPEVEAAVDAILALRPIP